MGESGEGGKEGEEGFAVSDDPTLAMLCQLPLRIFSFFLLQLFVSPPPQNQTAMSDFENVSSFPLHSFVASQNPVYC